MTLDVRLVGGGARAGGGGFGEVLFDVSDRAELQRAWGERARVSVEVRPSESLTGDFARPHRARIVLVDGGGRRMYLPHEGIVDRPSATGGWITLAGRPTSAVPMPLGFADAGFDTSDVAAVGVNVEAGLRHGARAQGTVELRDLRVRFEQAAEVHVLPPDPEVQAGAGERAERMRERLTSRLGSAGGLTVGLNLPHPSVERSNGELSQLYGTWLHGIHPDGAEPLDLRNDKVRSALRADLRAIRETLGAPALVRVMLLADLRSGVEIDESGTPVRVTDTATDNVGRLLSIAEDEHVVLVPVLTDFMLADGVAREGPDGAWKVGEHPELVTDGEKRRALMAAFERLVAAHADHPAVLAWEVMNEPSNAAAVVTPERFGSLQRFLREGVEAIHRAGELATVGYRNPDDAARFMKGRVPVDLGQAHFYPTLETHPAPFDLSSSADRAFGDVPGGWGEAPLRPDRIGQDLEQARRGGHRLLLYWSWRGDDPTGDGLLVRQHTEAIARAVRAAP